MGQHLYSLLYFWTKQNAKCVPLSGVRVSLHVCVRAGGYMRYVCMCVGWKIYRICLVMLFHWLARGPGTVAAFQINIRAWESLVQCNMLMVPLSRQGFLTPLSLHYFTSFISFSFVCSLYLHRSYNPALHFALQPLSFFCFVVEAVVSLDVCKISHLLPQDPWHKASSLTGRSADRGGTKRYVVLGLSR